MIMVDSSIWIDYFNGRDTPETRQLDSLLGIKPIAIGDIILTAKAKVKALLIHGRDETERKDTFKCP